MSKEDWKLEGEPLGVRKVSPLPITGDNREEALINIFRSGVYDQVFWLYSYFPVYTTDDGEMKKMFSRYPAFMEKFRDNIMSKGMDNSLSWHHDSAALDAFIDSVPREEFVGAMEEFLAQGRLTLVRASE